MALVIDRQRIEFRTFNCNSIQLMSTLQL